MPNFPSSSATQERHFADRKWREVIVQHEAFLGLALEDLQALHVVTRAQRRRHQRLSFASGENCGAMRSRQNTYFD